MYRATWFLRYPRRFLRRAKRSRLFLMIFLLCLFTILFSPLYVIYKPPAILIRYFEYIWPDVLWCVHTKSKAVALSIDDGPSAISKDILEILKENNATATFFIIGSQARENELMLRSMIKGGNELGNHAMRDEPSRSLKNATLIEQIHTVEEMLDRAYEAEGMIPATRYFRPGSGFFSQRMRRSLASLGYRLVLGNIYPHDPQIPFWRVNARHILSMLRPGSIIICHDRRSWTPPMLRTVLPEIRRRGYEITTVSGLLQKAESKKS